MKRPLIEACVDSYASAMAASTVPVTDRATLAAGFFAMIFFGSSSSGKQHSRRERRRYAYLALELEDLWAAGV